MSLVEFKQAILAQHKQGVEPSLLIAKVVQALRENVTLCHKTGSQVWTGLENTLGLTFLERQYMRLHYKGEFERQWREAQ